MNSQNGAWTNPHTTGADNARKYVTVYFFKGGSKIVFFLNFGVLEKSVATCLDAIGAIGR